MLDLEPDLIWRFGRYSFTPTRGLLASGAPVYLRPQVRRLLDLLVAARGRVVSNDEIGRGLWPNGSPSDDSIARCVMLLRKALAPDGGAIVKTVYGHGVRLASDPQRDAADPHPAIEGLLRSAAEMAATRNRDGLGLARKALEHVIALAPRAPGPHALLADLEVAGVVRGHRAPADGWNRVIEEVEIVLRLDPHSTRALATRAFALACKNPTDTSALGRLDAAIALDPTHWLARFYRAWLTAAHGRLDAAVADLDAALRTWPLERSLLSLKAWLVCCSGDLDAAEGQVHDSLKIRPDVELLLLVLSVVHRLRGDAGAAIREAQRAVDMTPGDSLPLSFLADALAAAGDRKAARRALSGRSDETRILNRALTAPALLCLGDEEAAVRVVREGRLEGCPWALLASCDPRLVPIRPVLRGDAVRQ